MTTTLQPIGTAAAARPARPARSGWPDLRIQRLGTVPYRRTWDRQRALVSDRAAGLIPDTLLLLSHPPVVTLGRGADPRHLLVPPAELAARGVEVVASDRGGDVTYHGPGQVVGYPIVDLTERGRDLHRYLRDLEEVLIRVLSGLGIDAGREPGLTGVWTEGGKVAAIGVRVSRWVAHHGFALNVDRDVAGFGLIVPCGIRDRGVTSIEALLGRPIERAPVLDAVESAFRDVFGSPA